jgi:hypothetical protein
MSWFKRKPPRYPPTPHTPAPHRSSPATEKAQQKAKESAPPPLEQSFQK